MPRTRVYEDNAAKQRAYRKRLKEAKRAKVKKKREDALAGFFGK